MPETKRAKNYLLKCGKCNAGSIVFKVKNTPKYIETFIGRCSDKKCKYQYGLKELCESNLTQL